ncbi:antitoxin Xre/MbcA/ParS toxin-binding domain-containing protein [Pseudomonas alloputida]|uniref:antitoxin Xre/MbcA/ParS toxin-binding domain-containing protein n=1 Tax=Pseudomonas TaxID=286 RepID=UPI003EECF20C
MFFTHPELERKSILAAVQRGHRSWRMVMQSAPKPWFYISQHSVSDEVDDIDTQMILIDDIYEFQRFVSAEWGGVRLGDIYFMCPVWNDARNPLPTWELSLLLEVCSHDPGDGDPSRIVFFTDSTTYFSDEPDGVWESSEMTTLYRCADFEAQLERMDKRDDKVAVANAARTIQLACELFRGDIQAAAEWLHTPLPELGNRAPCEMVSVEDQDLLAEVVTTLERQKDD